METKRLIIKQPSLDDLKAFKRIHNSDFVLKYNCMFPFDDNRATQQILADQQSDTVFYLYHKKDRHLIGAVYFDEDNLRYGVNSLCLSYYLSLNDARKGYMSEALKTLIPYVFETKNIDIISCRIFKENIASIQLAKKLGFIYEGCLKHAVRAYSGIIYDDCLYALYKSNK